MTTRQWWTAVALAIAVTGPACATDSTTQAVADAGPAFARFRALVEQGQLRGVATDVVEVWVCRVPAASTEPMYGGLPLRLDLTAARVAAAVEPLAGYFEALSNGAYRPTFVAGGTVDLGVGDGPNACVDAGLEASTTAATVVLAVADAEHADGRPGGQGSGGDPCPAAPPCPASQSRRAAYVGAADFHPDWGDAPPLDLVAHELAHTLGMVHSAYDPAATQPYLSALDLMSNSAAARAAQPERRDAPGTLAVQRLITGWLAAEAVATAPSSGGQVELARSDAADGTRVLVLPVDDTAFVTVEVVVAGGLQAHLSSSGVAVHLIDTASGAPVVNPAGSMAPGDLLVPGESIIVHAWRITVVGEWRIAVEPAGA